MPKTLRAVKSVDDYVINRKSWRMLSHEGDVLEGRLINLKRKGVYCPFD